MKKMFPERADIVDRPATRRNLLLMKRNGDVATLEGALDELLKVQGSVEQMGNLADRLEEAGAPNELVNELRTVIDDITEKEEPVRKMAGAAYPATPNPNYGGGDNGASGGVGNSSSDRGQKIKGRGRGRMGNMSKTERRVARWFMERLGKADFKQLTKEVAPQNGNGSQEPAPIPSRDELLKGVNEALSKHSEDLLKAVEEKVGTVVDTKIDQLKKDVEEIKTAKGLKKSIDGQETQSGGEIKKPLKKEFGKGMFDDIIAPQMVAAMNDRIRVAQRVAEEEEV